MRDPQDVAGEIEAAGGRMPSSWTTTSGGTALPAPALPGLQPLGTMWSAAVTAGRHRRPVAGPGDGARRLRGRVRRVRDADRREPRERRKRTPRAEDYGRRVRVFQQHGVQVNGSFVVGFDGDRRDTFTSLAQWIDAVSLECATFHILTPYPGTPLFRQLETEGRLRRCVKMQARKRFDAR